MDHCHTHTPSRYLSATETAQLLRLSPDKLEYYRIYGGGPAYQQTNDEVLYAMTDVFAWAESKMANYSQAKALVSAFDTQNPPRYLSTAEAAQLLRLSARTLEKHRSYGTGPAYRKLGGRVVYGSADVLAWAETGAKASTSDRSQGPSPAKRRAEAVDTRRSLLGGGRGPL